MQTNTEIDSHADAVRQSTDIGKQLRRAREAGGLSIQYVASSLHLSPRVIIALEENDFSQFQPVFVKGYLRNYCRLLNLSVEPMLESYNRTILPEQGSLQSSQQSPKAAKSNWVMYLLLFAGVVGLLAGIGGKYLFSSDGANAPSDLGANSLSLPSTLTATETDKPPAALGNVAGNGGDMGQSKQPVNASGLALPAEKSPSPVTTGSNDQTSPAKTESVNTSMEKSASTEPTGNNSPNPNNQSESQGQDTVAVHLSAAAWVGLRDQKGQRLAYKKMPAGTDLTFSGQAPFYMVLGNVSATKVELNGNPITPPKTKAGAVARFTLDKSGVSSSPVSESKPAKPNKKKSP